MNMCRPLSAGRPIALLALAAAALCRPARAASPVSPPVAAQPLAIEDVLRAPTLAAYSPPAFSPDGRRLAFVVTDNGRRQAAVDQKETLRHGLGWYGVNADIWVSELATNNRRRITGGTGNNWSPAWSPDGRRLAFLADRSAGPGLGPARLWIWESETDKLRQVGMADIREGFSPIVWSADGKSILVTLFPEELGREGFSAVIDGAAPASSASKPGVPGATPKVFESDPGAAGGAPMTDQINTNVWRRDLGLVDAETGEVRRIAKGVRIGSYVASPDRRRVAYSRLTKSEKPGAGQYLFDVVVQDFAGASPRVLATEQRLSLFANSMSFAPSADRVAWRLTGPLADDDVQVAPVTGGSSKRVAHNPHYEPDSGGEGDVPVWDPSGAAVYFTRNGKIWRAPADGSRPAAEFASLPGGELEILAPRRQVLFSPDRKSGVVVALDSGTKKIGFARVDLQSGSVVSIFSEARRYGGYGTEPAISPDGSTVAYIAEDAQHPADIFVRGGDLSRAVQVSEVAPALANRPFGRAEAIEWRDLDGNTLRGALVYPAGYEPGKRYPLIVKVYGGSSISNDLNRFGYASASFENLQLYATRGYALLLSDSKLNVGSPMVDLMKSVMPGIDKAVQVGLADPDRIGVTGHSYGGYSTLCLVTQSPRFKAAVMRAGMGDLVGAYGQLSPDGTNYGLAWAESGQGRMGGSPWEFRSRYLENSPIFYLDRVKTPMLIIHGNEDDAVQSNLADEVFTGLRRLGKTVTYARYQGENHWEGAWSYPNQLDSLQRSIAWFDRFLKAEPAPAGKAASTSK
ncbi:MAG: prolyl oligopeptidase family serine peptidase [Acidobacteriota bacterium]